MYHFLKKILKIKLIRAKLKDLIPQKNVKWTARHYSLKPEIIESYNPRKGVIKISKKNKIFDGNHRYHILIEHYGGEHKVIVKQYGNNLYLIRLLFINILFSPILIPIIIYKSIWED